MNAERIIAQLRERKMSIAVAESCTSGLLSAALTAVPGSSACFGYGVATYSNEAKKRLLGVPEETLARYGAVSAETALAMAHGLRELAGADIAVSITGIAGPGGGTEQKPVGLVYLGLVTEDRAVTEQHCFTGDREAVRGQSVAAALQMIAHCLTEGQDNV